jgi:rhodanese-related sulfurtransferase
MLKRIIVAALPIVAVACGTSPGPGAVVAPGQTRARDSVSDPATGSVSLSLNDLCAHSKGFTVSRTGAADVVASADGSATVGGLPPGDYTFTIKDVGYVPVRRTISVVAGQAAHLAADVKCQKLAVLEAAQAFTAKVAANPAMAKPVTAQALYNDLHTDTGKNLVVVSVRASNATKDDYAAGHIPGSLNIPYQTVADDSALAALGAPDPGKRYVDYCYTGHTAAISTAILNLLGYPASNLKFGFAAWTTNDAARTPLGVEPAYAKDLPIETTASVPTAMHETPWLANDGVTSDADAVRLAARAYLKSITAPPVISAEALYSRLTNADSSDDPFIISTQSPAAYAAGHIPGAVNIPLTEITKPEKLARIPTDRDIVVACYTGHVGGIVQGILGTLGYHKVKNLRFGLSGWTQNTAANGPLQGALPLFSSGDRHDYAFNTGSNP